MANPSVTYTFTNGTSADAGEVNTNYQDLIDSLTDGTKSLTMDACTFGGTATFNGAVTLGNGTGDDITITGSLAATLNIKTDGVYDIGSSTLGLSVAYFGDGGGNTVGIQAPAIAANYTFDLPGFTSTMPTSDGAADDYLKTDGSGAFAFVGGPAVTTKDNTYTLTTADKYLYVDTNTNGAWTLSLYAPGSSDVGRVHTIVKSTSDANALTVSANGTDTINGSTSDTSVNTQWEKLVLRAVAANTWYIEERKCNTAWVNDGAISITGTTSNPTKGTTSVDKAWYRRVGDSLEVRFEYAQSGGSPAAGSGDYLLGIPNSLVIDTAKVQTYTTIIGTGSTQNDHSVGRGEVIIGSGANVGSTSISVYNTTNVRMHISNIDDANGNSLGTFSSAFFPLTNNPLQLNATFTVPISGWKAENE